MIFLLSLFIQTGNVESNYFIRLFLFLITFTIIEHDDENKDDYIFKLRKPETLDILNIPSDCIENTAYALKVVENISHYFPEKKFSLIYLHEQNGFFSRSPAFCYNRFHRFSIGLSSSILRDHLFTREEIRVIIFHELGHLLDSDCQKNHNHYLFFRMIFMCFFYTNFSVMTDPLAIKNHPKETIITFLMVNTIIFLALQKITKKLHQYEYFADSCSVTHGDVSRESTSNTLKKLYFYLKQKKPSWIQQLFIFQFACLRTHPTLEQRCQNLKEFKSSNTNINALIFKEEEKNHHFSPIASEFGFIC